MNKRSTENLSRLSLLSKSLNGICRIILLASAFGLFTFSVSKANNLTLSNIVVNQTAGTVQFDIAWDNSWRITTNDPPYNWDAAWVFIKFRSCTADPSTQFTQGLISTTLGDHTFGTLEPTQSAGLTTTPSGINIQIDASPNNTGVMLRRTTDGAGPVSTTVTLKLSNLPASGSLDTRVFGIEMVFIKDGTYTAGDGQSNTTYCSWASFSTTQTSYTGVNISSESALTYYEKDGQLEILTQGGAGSCYLCGTASVAATFPKGFNAFYMMKYEITQGQYADFLNTTPFSHFPAKDGQNRHRINNSGTFPNVFNCVVSTVDKGDRACNWLSWNNTTAYLDWACLRPLTEFEYEKACRGLQGSAGLEFAWANTTITAAATITGPENGTETVSTANANSVCNNQTFGGTGDGGTGPLRVGIFATSSTTTRQQTGASFYGVMDLSGNVAEYYVSAYAGFSAACNTAASSCSTLFPIGVARTGLAVGDGTLAATGFHNQSGWPNATAPESSSIIKRGGSWSTTPIVAGNAQTNNLQVSNRGGGLGVFAPDNASGGRGGRN